MQQWRPDPPYPHAKPTQQLEAIFGDPDQIPRPVEIYYKVS